MLARWQQRRTKVRKSPISPPDESLENALAAVFEPSFLSKLDRFQLNLRHSLSIRPGQTPMPRGAQRSGIELEAYKGYHPGDDLRHLDWNAYSRLDQFLIKTFRAEREAPLHIFLDASASMTAPRSDRKLEVAVQLAASLAYIGLANHDPVRLALWSEALPGHGISSPVWRHREALSALRDFLAVARGRGRTSLGSGLRATLTSFKTPGLAVLLSDFLAPPGEYEPVLLELVARRFHVTAVRIIGTGERDPSSLFHRAQIVDAETGMLRNATLDATNLARYEAALTQHLGGLEAFCGKHQIKCIIADTHLGLEHCLFYDFTRAGVLR